ncbi:MAG: response regulator, partial [Desulfobacteraceae bacterium]|nr:response regulator [Desulfobacteraceae bacterium]
VINHQIPIIALTAHANEEQKNKCIKSGMNDFMSKPFQPNLLSDMLTKWLPKKDPKHLSPATEIFEDDILNWTKFLERVLDDHELAKDIFNEFLEITPKKIEAIQKAIDKGDALSVSREAHTLKGSCANVSAMILNDLANKIETFSKNGDLTKALTFVPIIEKQFNILKQYWSDKILKSENKDTL